MNFTVVVYYYYYMVVISLVHLQGILYEITANCLRKNIENAQSNSVFIRRQKEGEREKIKLNMGTDKAHTFYTCACHTVHVCECQSCDDEQAQ